MKKKKFMMILETMIKINITTMFMTAKSEKTAALIKLALYTVLLEIKFTVIGMKMIRPMLMPGNQKDTALTLMCVMKIQEHRLIKLMVPLSGFMIVIINLCLTYVNQILTAQSKGLSVLQCPLLLMKNQKTLIHTRILPFKITFQSASVLMKWTARIASMRQLEPMTNTG